MIQQSIIMLILIALMGLGVSCKKDDDKNNVNPVGLVDSNSTKTSMPGTGTGRFNNEEVEVTVLADIKNLGFGFNVFYLACSGQNFSLSIATPDAKIPSFNKTYPISGNFPVTPGASHAYLEATDSNDDSWIADAGSMVYEKTGSGAKIRFNNVRFKKDASSGTCTASMEITLK